MLVLARVGGTATPVSTCLRGSGSFAELLDARLFTDLSLSALIVVDGTKLLVSAQRQFWSWAPPPGTHVVASPGWEITSDRLMSFDLAGGALTTAYDRPTRTYGVQLMGAHQGKLFVTLPNDGVSMVDVADPARPRGTKFLRTLGWATHLEFAGDEVYVASGNFGVFNIKLDTAGEIPVD